MEWWQVTRFTMLALVLVYIAVIDVRTRTIDDAAILVLLILGLAGETADLLASASSGAAFFAFFWAIRRLHFLYRREIGLGFGDVKLAGAIGVWLSIPALPLFTALSALTALSAISAMYFFLRKDVSKYRLPFAPFMCLSLVLNLFLYRTFLNYGIYYDDWI